MAIKMVQIVHFVGTHNVIYGFFTYLKGIFVSYSLTTLAITGEQGVIGCNHLE